MAVNQAVSQSVSDISAPGKYSPPSFQVGQRFNPFRLFAGIFIPEAICKYRGVSLGAKLVYGRLCRYAGEDGEAYPALATLGRELGIGGKQARRYVRELERYQFIQANPEPGRRSHYFFKWHQAFCNGEVGTSRKPPLPKMGAEENHHQENQKKSQGSSSSSSLGGFGGKGKTTSAKPKNKNLPQKADDENRRTPLENPEMEFRTRIAERHGTMVDADTLLKDVKIELDNVPLIEFLAADLKATTAPASLRNPHGHYRKLARKVGRRKEAAVLESLTTTMQQGQDFLKRGAPASFKPACTCNDGKLPGGEYCTCKTGNLRQELDGYMSCGGGPVITSMGQQAGAAAGR